MRFPAQSWLIFWILFTLFTTSLWIEWKKLPDGFLHVVFLDVEQGDSELIITPEGKRFLVDGGPETTVLSKLDPYLPFFDRTIDGIILTHPHEDHISGLIEVIDRYQVKTAYFTGIEYQSPFYAEFLQQLQQKAVSTVFLTEKSDFSTTSGVKFDLFSDLDFPLQNKKLLEPNNTSSTLRLSYGEKSFLLVGDAETAAESLFLKNGKRLTADVLKIGHHGSKTASSFAFLEAVHPKYVIIEVGADNQFGHPHKETMEKLKNQKITPLLTSTSGTIEAITDGKTLTFSLQHDANDKSTSDGGRQIDQTLADL